MKNIDRKTAGILAAVFPVVFNLLFFVLPLRRNATDWVCYAFIHIAYLMLVASILYVGDNKEQYHNRAAVAMMVARYFFTELFIGVGLIVINRFVPFGMWLAFIAQILLLSIYFIITLTQMMANRHDESVERVRREEIHYIQACADMARSQMGKASGAKANKAIEQVFDKLRTSPSKTVPQAKEIEMAIYSAVSGLKADMDEQEILKSASSILSMIEQRNAILKSSYR